MSEKIEINLKFSIPAIIKTKFSCNLKEIELEQIILSFFKLDEYDKKKLNVLIRNKKILEPKDKTDSIKSGATYEFDLEKIFNKIVEEKDKLLYFCPFIPPNEIVLTDKIAEGGFGEIFKCTYEKGEKGKNYVFKNLKSEDETILKAYFQEVMTYSKLNHQNIPKFIGITYEIFKKNGFIMEYISGQNLLEFVEQSKIIIDDKEKLSIIYQLSDVLCYLHENEIIHRDLKPDNIIIRRDNLTKTKIFLLDYGLSRTMDQKNIYSSMVSYFQNQTHVYQYLSGNELFKFNSFDIWSFGCLVYYLYTGKHPYDRNVSLMGKSILCKEKFFKKTDFNDDFIYQIVEDCCKFNPTERITSEKLKMTIYGRINYYDSKSKFNIIIIYIYILIT